MKTVNSPSIKEAKLAANQNTNFLIKKGYVRAGFYTYTDESEVPIYWRIRLDHPEKEKWIRPFTLINGKWEFKEPTFDHGKTLYNLHGIANKPNETVWIVEGEKCVDALAKLGILATTSGSATSAEGADWEPLKNRSVIIWPDNDEPGIKYSHEVTAIIQKLNCKVQWIDVEKLWPADGADADNWIHNNHVTSCDDIKSIQLIQPQEDPGLINSFNEDRSQTKSQILIEIASECKLFTSPDDIAYASIPFENHTENWAIESKGFRRWLRKEFYLATGSAPKQITLSDALSVLDAQARFDGGVHPVHTRVAGLNGRVYLDLANNNWEVVEVSKEGWHILPSPPVKFIRASGMQPLPQPQKDGSVYTLRDFVNLSNDDDFILLISYLLFCFNPKGPYPILIVQGEQGSAKSTFGKLIRSLIDPSSASLRTTPRNEQDLMIAAQNGWLLNFDNISSLAQKESDALCRLSTGAGFATRKLYSNSEEVIINASRPICLNGITEFATKDDLLDRALVLKLPPIPENKRKDENTFWEEFEKSRPAILGALLDNLVNILKNIPNTTMHSSPRMADFAKFGTAAEQGLGLERGAFMRAYEANRIHSVIMGIEADPVAQAIRDWDIDEWEGTAAELLEDLNSLVGENTHRNKFWPSTPSNLSNRIRRFIPSLRKLGIQIDFNRAGHEGTRLITIIVNRGNAVSAASKSQIINHDTSNASVEEEREVFSL